MNLPQDSATIALEKLKRIREQKKAWKRKNQARFRKYPDLSREEISQLAHNSMTPEQRRERAIKAVQARESKRLNKQ